MVEEGVSIIIMLLSLFQQAVLINVPWSGSFDPLWKPLTVVAVMVPGAGYPSTFTCCLLVPVVIVSPGKLQVFSCLKSPQQAES